MRWPIYETDEPFQVLILNLNVLFEFSLIFEMRVIKEKMVLGGNLCCQLVFPLYCLGTVCGFIVNKQCHPTVLYYNDVTPTTSLLLFVIFVVSDCYCHNDYYHLLFIWTIIVGFIMLYRYVFRSWICHSLTCFVYA